MRSITLHLFRFINWCRKPARNRLNFERFPRRFAIGEISFATEFIGVKHVPVPDKVSVVFVV